MHLILNLFGTSKNLSMCLLSSNYPLVSVLLTNDFPPPLVPSLLSIINNIVVTCATTIEELSQLESAFNLLKYALTVILNSIEPKTIYLASKVILNGCKKGGDARTMKQILGKQWVKQTREVMGQIQTKPECHKVKKLYEIAIEIEDKWLKKRENNGIEKELEYEKDF
jgi:hypothetical protein